MTRPERLSKKAWIDAGLRALAEGGVDGVRVEVIAKALGVTKGSFYWHFADREALFAALLDEWEARDTEGAIAAVEKTGGAPCARLLRLLELCAEDDGRIETRLRAWALTSPTTAARIEAVDRRRIGHVRHLLLELGLGEADAAARARMIYRAWIGELMLLTHRPTSERLQDARSLFELVMLRSQQQ